MRDARSPIADQIAAICLSYSSNTVFRAPSSMLELMLSEIMLLIFVVSVLFASSSFSSTALFTFAA